MSNYEILLDVHRTKALDTKEDERVVVPAYSLLAQP